MWGDVCTNLVSVGCILSGILDKKIQASFIKTSKNSPITTIVSQNRYFNGNILIYNKKYNTVKIFKNY